MSALENTRIVRAHLDAFNARRSAAVSAEINAPDACWTAVPSGTSFRGPDGYLQFLDVWGRAFPDARIEIRNVSGGEDWAVAEFVGRGTHTGPLRTPMGEVPPTGNPIDLAFCEVYRLRGGKIASCNLYFDAATMMRQLGLAA